MTADSALWQSAQNLMKSRVNLDKLFDALSGVECNRNDLVVEFFQSAGDQRRWLTPARSAYYLVRRRINRNLVGAGWITITIQLTSEESEGSNWEFGRRAKVLAGYSRDPNLDYAWEFDAESPDSSGRVEDCQVDGNRWVFADDGMNSWFFAVSLDALTCTDCVTRYIATPLQRMICGENAVQVLSEIEGFLCKPPQS